MHGARVEYSFRGNECPQPCHARGRFEREALAWVRMEEHEHIAQARFLELIDGRPLLFIEYVSGGDLASWVDTSRLMNNVPSVLRLGLQFCDGRTSATHSRNWRGTSKPSAVTTAPWPSIDPTTPSLRTAVRRLAKTPGRSA